MQPLSLIYSYSLFYKCVIIKWKFDIKSGRYKLLMNNSNIHSNLKLRTNVIIHKFLQSEEKKILSFFFSILTYHTLVPFYANGIWIRKCFINLNSNPPLFAGSKTFTFFFINHIGLRTLHLKYHINISSSVSMIFFQCFLV